MPLANSSARSSPARILGEAVHHLLRQRSRRSDEAALAQVAAAIRRKARALVMEGRMPTSSEHQRRVRPWRCRS